MRLPGWWWRAYHRGSNRVFDVLARLSGTCNASTWDGEGYAGGYAHWRCMKARRHGGLHRFYNYVWPVEEAGAGRVVFAPLALAPRAAHRELVAREIPFQHITGRRYSTGPRRRRR